jgi:menaquinone-dependent protoporphyrinogen oxidase
MPRVLIVYSSTDGHTVKICQRLRQAIEPSGAQVQVVSVADADGVDLGSYDTIVVGASIRRGRHSKAIHEFVDARADQLAAKASAFFSVNIVARKPDKNRPETNPYLRKFLERIRWQPRLLAVFAGKLDYPRYGFVDRLMIRFIMLITGGPTDPRAVVEFTDWNEVEAFGRRVAQLHG